MRSSGSRALLLSLEGVTAARGRPLLENVDWRLGEGELWAVAGPTGAGKSSLLRVLRGQLPITRGRLRFGPDETGRALAADPARRILVASFAAQASLLKGAAGYAQSRWHAGHDDAVARARDVLGTALRLPACRRLADALDLRSILGRRVTELSNGERRKLQLVRVAATGPVVLALDNPFNGLDQAARATVSDAAQRLHGDGMTVLVLTSREEEIFEAVTHVLLLKRGRVIAAGPKEVVLADRRLADVMAPASAADASAPGAPADSRPPKPAPPRSQPVASASPERDPVVALRGVDVRYGDTPVLTSLDWTVRRGERWVVVGPNGAGKSALLSLILTDNPQAYANDVSLFGRRRGSGDSIWEIRRRIGCVSPEMHLYSEPDRPAAEVIAAGFPDFDGRRGPPAPEELGVATERLSAFGLGDRAEARFGELSEGEQQLVLLARALAKRPELLVLDEPCQGLDSRGRALFLRMLERELAETDTTLVYVTHDLNEVPTAVTRGLLLRGGRVELDGSAWDVLEAYAQPLP